MDVTVEVIGEGTETVTVTGPDEDGPTATYADLLAAVDLRPAEATVLVDEQPVPEDAVVEADSVQVLRLVAGGSVEPSRKDGVEATGTGVSRPRHVRGRLCGFRMPGSARRGVSVRRRPPR